MHTHICIYIYICICMYIYTHILSLNNNTKSISRLFGDGVLTLILSSGPSVVFMFANHCVNIVPPWGPVKERLC